MKDLDYVLNSERRRGQEEKSRLERLQQFKGLKKIERQKTCKIIQSEIYANATLDNEYIHIKRDLFDKIINEIEMEE